MSPFLLSNLPSSKDLPVKNHAGRTFYGRESARKRTHACARGLHTLVNDASMHAFACALQKVTKMRGRMHLSEHVRMRVCVCACAVGSRVHATSACARREYKADNEAIKLWKVQRREDFLFLRVFV